MSQVERYRQGKDEMADLVRSLDDATLARTCAACPEWTIRDVVAHHVHYLGGVADGSVPKAMQHALTGDATMRPTAAAERDRWTQSGVDERRSRPFSAVLAEWDEVVATMPDHAAYALLDLTMHLADIRETLGDERGRQDPLVEEALAGYFHFSLLPRLAGVDEAVGLHCTDTGAELLPDADAATVAGTAYELLRSVGGRRTRHEADAALDWGETTETVRTNFSVYGWPVG